MIDTSLLQLHNNDDHNMVLLTKLDSYNSRNSKLQEILYLGK